MAPIISDADVDAIVNEIMTTTDERRFKQLRRRIALNADLMDKISERFEELEPGWGKLYRTDKKVN